MWPAEGTDSFSITGVRDLSGTSGRFVGDWLEARVRHWLVPSFLGAEINALLLAKGRFLETANARVGGDITYVTTARTATGIREHLRPYYSETGRPSIQRN